MLLDDTAGMAVSRNCQVGELPSLEPGGPREFIYFDPASTRVGIVTCGGLCPGLNNVIRGLVLEFSENYGVTDIVGFRDSYRGLVSGSRNQVDPNGDLWMSVLEATASHPLQLVT